MSPASTDNGNAAQASASASQASTNASAAQQAQSDLATLQGIIEGKINYDVQGLTETDVNGLTTDIANARSAVTALQQEQSSLQAAGLPVPSGLAAAITSAQGTISNAMSTANGDIGQVNADVVTAYQVANGIATGSCDGPGSPPSPTPAISDRAASDDGNTRWYRPGNVRTRWKAAS